MRAALPTEFMMIANGLMVMACAAVIWDLLPSYLLNDGERINGWPSWLGLNTVMLVFDLKNYKEQIDLKRIIKGALLCPFWLLLRLIVI